jgi:molybdenum cofactor guanylyltransferase
MKCTGIILAGGKSFRMGFDKGLLEFNGKRLVEYPLDLLGKYCEELIISTNNPAYAKLGVKVVTDEIIGKGPVSGLYSALKQSNNTWNIVTGCDMPFLNTQLFDELFENLSDNMGIIPVHQGFAEPLCAIYHQKMADVFNHAIREELLSLYRILRKAPVSFYPVDSLLKKFPLLFSNFNSETDIIQDTI